MKNWIRVVVFGISLIWAGRAPAAAATVAVNGQTAGPTPFISLLDLTVSQPGKLRSIQFTVLPKSNSVTRPIQAVYSSSYLQSHGYLNVQTGQITLPVFGLYAHYANSVALSCAFKGSPTSRLTVTVPTAAFNDPTGYYVNPTVVQARSARRNLSYDYIMLKGYGAGISPIIIDTDAEVRWVGTAGVSSTPAILYQNGVYVGNGTALMRMELTGTTSNLFDYASLGVIGFHHNFDPGKRGILMDVDQANIVESTVIEVDPAGNPLQTWHLDDIISEAMIAGGDDPSGLVKPGIDWLHNNACAYRKSDDTLLVSGREDFVIALDYESGTIRWILGDPTKNWYQYPSLRKYALALGSSTLPPIGQHAISIVKGNKLLLFDDGANSGNQTPAGENRDYSAARKYRINTKRMTATEIWTYLANPSIYSPFCSSIYEDRPKSYLIDYALAGPNLMADIVGVNRKGEIEFFYSYPLFDGCGLAWNAIPVHLEKLIFNVKTSTK